MLVIVQKLPMATWFLPALNREFPGETFEFLVANQYGWPFVFNYPSKLTWSEYPLWRAASYMRSADTQFRGVPDEDGRLKRSLCDYESMPRHERAIALVDASYSAINAAHHLRKTLQNLGKFDQWLGTVAVHSLVEADVALELKKPYSDADLELTLEGAQLKSDFDFSFLVNSAGLLTRCYFAVGGASPNPVFSKYQIQTLYAVRNHEVLQQTGKAPALTEGKLVALMTQWTGSGRYTNDRASIGSCSSRIEILSQLVQHGLLDLNSKRSYRLSTIGHAFLDKLHPDCEDPDLPFRLAQWREDPVAGRVAAQRYIRTWFGKQKRFMG